MWAPVVVGLFIAARLPAECLPAFERGDSNRDAKLDLSDPIFTLGYLFLGSGEPGCLDAADADDSGKVDLSDAVFTVGYLFLGGSPLPAPIPGSCGLDPTDDALGCLAFPPCEVLGQQPCTSNDCCDPGSYCEKAVDDCGGVGECVVRPDICPRIFDPWCGCDGVTYSNRCSAQAAGVNVVLHGECLKPGGCISNEECDAESFCATGEGACGTPGECRARPVGCAKIFDPVCGCDDVTYGNECEAGVQGISVAYRGECQRGTPCTSNDQCDGVEYCIKDIGNCVGDGTCGPRPDLCAQFFDPMCGCDGVTYGNGCLAGVAGVNLSKKGPCNAGPPCRFNEDCAEESYCARSEGFCDDQGFCLVRPGPGACVEEPLDPVCGCDGVTYANSCLAATAGISVLRHGPCELGAECKSNEDCIDATFCFKKDSFCDLPGICLADPTPEECQDAPEDPICGCDNVTYKNSCDANLHNMSMAYSGPCDDKPHCNSNEDCPIDSYCAVREGFCGGLGLCVLRPTECPPDLFDPVCGCDQITYANECGAAMAGTSILFHGECKGGGELNCETSAFCGQGNYCAKAIGDCDGRGQCATTPNRCEELFDPVCGCDGITYDNECTAHQAGVNVLQAGACP